MKLIIVGALILIALGILGIALIGFLEGWGNKNG
jgi:hypothetical protein